MKTQTCSECGSTPDAGLDALVKLKRVVIIELPGTMYNIIYGTNRYALFWLGMLGLPPSMLGRFRDCYLQRDLHGGLEICIYTRNGGRYRRANALASETLRTHPLYLWDYDDEHDPTYASYIFRPSASMCPTLDLMVARDPEHAIPKSHHARAQAFIHKMQAEPQAPEVRRVKMTVNACSRKSAPAPKAAGEPRKRR